MKSLARIRPINIFIILATQLLVYFTFVLPIEIGDTAGVNYPEFIYYFLIAIVTCLVTIGGYVINDIYDVEIDKINKPQKAIQDVKPWLLVYKILFVSGLLIIAYVSYQLGNIYYTPIYIISWLVLHAYSKSWKCRPFIGNLVVAAMSSAAVLIVLAPGFSIYLTYDEETKKRLFIPVLFYTIMAFLLSLTREMVKDLEDLEGDKHAGCQTLAVKAGEVKSKVFIQFFHAAGIMSIVLFSIIFYDLSRYIWIGFIVVIILFFVYQIRALALGRGPKDYKRIQSYYKLMMILGIVVFVAEPYVAQLIWG